jgi:hypothetical protein
MTVGDVLDRVEAAGPRERRELLDEARAAVGLAPTRPVEARRHFGDDESRAARHPDAG